MDITIFVARAGRLDRRQLPDIEKIYQDKRLKNMALVLNGIDLYYSRYYFAMLIGFVLLPFTFGWYLKRKCLNPVYIE